MIDREHDLPIGGSVYYQPRPVPEADLGIMR